MKIIKTLFLVSLFNLFIVGSIVLAFKSDKNTVIKPQPISKGITTTTDSRCIITTDGVKYDISQYQYQHSGGDIFTCGTDMSNIFHSKHGQKYLKQMAKYRI